MATGTYPAFITMTPDGKTVYSSNEDGDSVTPISTADYPTPARRPANSALNSNLFGAVFGYCAQAWQTRAQETVKMLLKDSRVET